MKACLIVLLASSFTLLYKIIWQIANSKEVTNLLCLGFSVEGLFPSHVQGQICSGQMWWRSLLFANTILEYRENWTEFFPSSYSRGLYWTKKLKATLKRHYCRYWNDSISHKAPGPFYRTNMEMTFIWKNIGLMNSVISSSWASVSASASVKVTPAAVTGKAPKSQWLNTVKGSCLCRGRLSDLRAQLTGFPPDLSVIKDISLL